MPPFPHVYFAGRWTSRAEAAVPIGSLALRYGVSVFEGIRLYSPVRRDRPPRPFLLAEHVDRLSNSLALLGMSDPGVGELPELLDELVTRNAIAQDAYVRVAATPIEPGDLADQIDPVLSITATPMGRKRWLAENIGMSLTISDWQRASPAVFPPAAKNISNYAGPRLAWLAAQRAGFDGCVLTNRAGRLCEAPTAALFLVKDGVLLTPALSEDVLPSITRAWLLRSAAENGLPSREAELTREDAYSADEAFLCGTGMEIASVRAFDGWELGQAEQAPITRELTAYYFVAARGAGDRLATSSPVGRLVQQ